MCDTAGDGDNDNTNVIDDTDNTYSNESTESTKGNDNYTTHNDNVSNKIIED